MVFFMMIKMDFKIHLLLSSWHIILYLYYDNIIYGIYFIIPSSYIISYYDTPFIILYLWYLMVYYDDNTMLKLIDSEAFSHTLRSSGPSAATR